MKRAVANRSTRMPRAGIASTWRSLSVTSGRKVEVSESQLEKERILESALDEYLAERDAGKPLAASDFCKRYPSVYRRSVRKYIDVHETIDQFADVEEDQWPLVGTELLGFKILRELGVGAFARVYLASETALGRRLVAIKVALYGTDEGETLGKLAHPNVVPVHSVQTDPETGMMAVCMPYLGSATLADVLEVAFADDQPPRRARTILDAVARREQLVRDEEDDLVPRDRLLERGSYVDGVIHLGIQMAEALEYTHGQQVLHRDLKPSNVLVTPQGSPMLLDFNLSCDLELDVNRLGGTLPYMPPEQIRDVYLRPYDVKRPGDERSDVFSLGVILYELLTGQLPFGDPPSSQTPAQVTAETYLKAQQSPPTPIRELNPEVDPDTARLIARCLDPVLDRRPPNATTLVNELSDYFALRSRLKRWSGRNRRGLTVTAVLLLVALGTLGTWMASRDPPTIRAYRAGLIEYDAGQPERAVELFSQSLDANPDNALAKFARAVAHDATGNAKLALVDLEEVVEASRERVFVEYLAYGYLQRHIATRQTLALYGDLVDRFPQDTALRVNFGCLWLPKSPGYALREADAALELDPQLSTAYQLRVEANWERLRNPRGSTGEERELTETILADIQRARQAAGGSNPLLDLRAATTLGLKAAREPELESELRVLVQQNLAAIVPQMPRKVMDSFTRTSFQQWVTELWFVELLARCPDLDSNTVFDRRTYLITPPDPDEIRNRLAAYRQPAARTAAIDGLADRASTGSTTPDSTGRRSVPSRP